MKTPFKALAVLVLLLGAGAGARALWARRPWRPAVTVNGRVLSAGELAARAETLWADARRVAPGETPPAWTASVRDAFAREAARAWIVKEVFLAEALARGCAGTAADEKEALQHLSARLGARRLAPEAYFREGPLAEPVKRRDFRESVLVNKFLAEEVRAKIALRPEEVRARLAPQADHAARRAAIDALRAARYAEGARTLFRALFAKADVKSPLYPELERLDAVSPARAGAADASDQPKN